MGGVAAARVAARKDGGSVRCVYGTGAREAFITAATTLVMPVVRIDGHVIGNGRPGSIATGLRERFHEVVEVTAV